jgi:hypothetical protein
VAEEIKTRWLEIARERFGDAVTTTANGRWALCSLNERGAVVSVYLLASETQAHAAALGVSRPKVVDLLPPVVPDLPDDWEDRARERKQRKSVVA